MIERMKGRTPCMSNTLMKDIEQQTQLLKWRKGARPDPFCVNERWWISCNKQIISTWLWSRSSFSGKYCKMKTCPKLCSFWKATEEGCQFGFFWSRKIELAVSLMDTRDTYSIYYFKGLFLLSLLFSKSIGTVKNPINSNLNGNKKQV